MVQRLLAGFALLASHRGGAHGRVGSAFAIALTSAIGVVQRGDGADSHTDANVTVAPAPLPGAALDVSTPSPAFRISTMCL